MTPSPTPPPDAASVPPGGPPPVPAARRAGAPYRIAVVCLGNICRSPMAAVVLERRLEEAGLDGAVEVVSAGTGHWHIGEPMDRRAATVLTAHGYDASRHRAQQFDATWHDEYDLILTMDASNHEDVVALSRDDAGRVRMFREFDPRAGETDSRADEADASAGADSTRAGGPGAPDVPDPYFGGDDGFDRVLAIVERTARALVRELEATLANDASRAGR